MQFDADDADDDGVRGDQAEEAADGDEAEDLRRRRLPGYELIRVSADGTQSIISDWSIIPLPHCLIAPLPPQQRQ